MSYGERPGDDAVMLAELIATRRNELALSYERIAARARESGLHLTADALVALANEEPRAMPRPVTIKAIAAGLDLPVIEVLMAAACSVGLVAHAAGDDDRALAWAELTEDLDAAQRDQVLSVVREVVKVMQPVTRTDRGSISLSGGA